MILYIYRMGRLQRTQNLTVHTPTIIIKPKTIHLSNDPSSLGFIILRHVNSEKTDKYWQESYDCIRRLYPTNKIIIIDDNSNYSFVSQKHLSNTEVINSEYPGRGELLPYYYYAKNKWFESALIIHDSVFVKQPIHGQIINYKIIWNFDHHWDQPDDEIRIINSLSNNQELLQFHGNKNDWKGCFGGMTMIQHDFLKHLDNKYNFTNMLNVIHDRHNRMSFERVIACILQMEYKHDVFLLGSIHHYCPWGYSYDKYKTQPCLNLPLIKVWTGR